jgi:TRAP-type C4-dicarboxylate transport system permease small subunit
MPTDHPVLRRLLGAIARIEDGLLIGLLTLMVVLAAAQIFMRNVLGVGVAGADQLLRLLVLWLGMLGAVAASRGDRHINIDILSRFLTERPRLMCRLAVDAFAALVCALIAVHAARFVHAEYEAGVMAFGRVPAWLTELILPVAFILIALRYVILFFADLRRLRAGAPP